MEEKTADGDRELRIALDGHAAGKSTRGIAEDLYGKARVSAEWTADGALRTKTRRLLFKAQAHAERG